MKKVYIGLLQTGTIASIGIKYFTRYKYSHVVLSLDSSFNTLYSFGRKKYRNAFNAGFVSYGIDNEFFTKKFYNTKCAIYEVEIDDKKYKKLKKILKQFEKNQMEYHYDFRGLFIRIFLYEPKARDKYYVCSQFVATVLNEAGIWDLPKPASKIRAKDFENLNNAVLIYEGKLLDIKSSHLKL